MARSEYQQLWAALHRVQMLSAEPLQALVRTAILRGDPKNLKDGPPQVWDANAGKWKVDGDAPVFDNQYQKMKRATTDLIPVLKGWYTKSIEKQKAAVAAELASHANVQPAQAEAELAAVESAEWKMQQMQHLHQLAQQATERHKELLDKMDTPAAEEGSIIMGTAFEDLADPETGLVTRERWNSHFGKDDFDKYDQDDSGLMDKDEWNKACISLDLPYISLYLTRMNGTSHLQSPYTSLHLTYQLMN